MHSAYITQGIFAFFQYNAAKPLFVQEGAFSVFHVPVIGLFILSHGLSDFFPQGTVHRLIQGSGIVIDINFPVLDAAGVDTVTGLAGKAGIERWIQGN